MLFQSVVVVSWTILAHVILFYPLCHVAGLISLLQIESNQSVVIKIASETRSSSVSMFQLTVADTATIGIRSK